MSPAPQNPADAPTGSHPIYRPQPTGEHPMYRAAPAGPPGRPMPVAVSMTGEQQIYRASSAGPRPPGPMNATGEHQAYRASTTGSYPRVPGGTGEFPPLVGRPPSVPARVSGVLHRALADLAASETALASTDRVKPPKVLLNLAVYVAFAILAAIVQVPLLLILSHTGPVLAAIIVFTPAAAFGLSWLTIGALTPRWTNRMPLAGAVISLLSLVPVAALLAATGLQG